MLESSDLTEDFWRAIENLVASKVEAARRRHPPCPKTIDYLQDLELVARRDCQSRNTIQIIQSARSLLGDHTDLGPLRHRLTDF